MLGNIGNALSNVSSKLKSGLGMAGSTYRTGVVNDFSIVTKAVFYVLEEKNGKYTVTDRLPVQINPSSITRESEVNVKSLAGLKGSVNDIISESFGASDYSNSMYLDLIYSIFDEYNIRTMDGLVGGGTRGDMIFTELSLENEKVTSLPNLRKLCGSGKRVLFKWGLTEVVGQLSNVKCEYTAFSRWGEPLECHAAVTLQLEPKNSPAHFDNIKGNIMAKVKTYEKTSNILNKTALGLSQALR